MIDQRFVLRRATHFYHLHVVRAFENTVAYMRWLQYTIPCLQDKRGTLLFVNHSYPASVAVDHLKLDIMVVHIVRHRPTVRYSDVRGNESATAATRDQVTVLHAGPPGLPVTIIGWLQDLVLLEAEANTVS